MSELLECRTTLLLEVAHIADDQLALGGILEVRGIYWHIVVLCNRLVLRFCGGNRDGWGRHSSLLFYRFGFDTRSVSKYEVNVIIVLVCLSLEGKRGAWASRLANQVEAGPKLHLLLHLVGYTPGS
jgi:hypothetical protein